MLISLFLALSFFVYLVVPVLLWLSRRNEEQEELFERWAGGVGVAAGVVTLGTNWVLVFSPELHPAWTGSFAFLLMLASSFPLLTITGGVMTWIGHLHGPRVLMIADSLWLAIMTIGLLASMIVG